MKRLIILLAAVTLFPLMSQAQNPISFAAGSSPQISECMNPGQFTTIQLFWFDDGVSTYTLKKPNGTFASGLQTGYYIVGFIDTANATAYNGTWTLKRTGGGTTETATCTLAYAKPAGNVSPTVTPSNTALWPWQSATLKVAPASPCYSYQWNKQNANGVGYTIIAGATNSTYVTNKAGKYACFIVDQTGGQSVFSAPATVQRRFACLWRNATSNTEFTSPAVLRTTGSLIASVEDPVTVKVINMVGSIVHTASIADGNELTITNLPSGIYFLSATNKAGEVFTQKIALVK
jgi:hypothetical protein